MKRPAVRFALLVLLSLIAGFVFAKAQKALRTAFEQGTAPVPARTVPADWRENRMAPGHAVHVLNQELECNDCHDPAETTFNTPDPGVCSACHTEQTSHWHTGVTEAPTDCYDCHSFKASDDIHSRWDCTRCHGSFDTENLRGLSMHTSMGCENCHNPHRPVEETAKDCDSCHKAIRVQHGRPTVSGTCSGCHGGHKLASEAASCMECHATREPKVPQTATFGEGHDACVNCHKPHSFSKSTALSCNQCHRGVRALAQEKAKQHGKCTSCHQPHAILEAVASCETCHSDVSPKHPKAAGKGECVTCHNPHPKRATEIALQCSSCHKEAASESAFHSKRAVCTDCHKPHAFDLSRVNERNLCSRCHAKQIGLTSKNKGHSSCESCHKGNVHALDKPVACATCHEEILDKSPSGHRECTSCHEPHGGTFVRATACLSCHKAGELPGLHSIAGDAQEKAHQECTACHEMHVGRVKADRVTCMSCHDDIAKHEPDAKRCTGCHTFRD